MTRPLQPDPGSGGGTRRARTPSLGAALLVLFAAAVLFVAAGAPLQILLGEPGLLLSQILFLALPPVAFVLWRRYDVVETLSLRMPDARQLGAGLLLLVGATQVAWFLAWLQSLWLPVPVEYLEALAEVLTADSLPRFAWLLLFVAVVPAIAEELLFRGVLLSGFRSHLPAVAAVVATGLVFGLFHVAPQTGFRILPTAWLGMVLAWVVVVSGSLPLAVALHFVNNAALLALAALPATQHLVSGTDEAPSLLFLPLAILLLLAGGAGLASSRPAPDARRGPMPSEPPPDREFP